MSEPKILTVGPLSMDFQDGELRYLRAGREELLRRVYFSVRDEAWGTVIPDIVGLKIDQRPDGFTVSYQGRCQTGTLDFSYSVMIDGFFPGDVTIRTSGRLLMPSQARRFGLCAHMGARAVCGRPFAAVSGSPRESVFPDMIDQVILAEYLPGLSYTTASGAVVQVTIHGGQFGLEDQRHFGDSSFKLFSDMPYAYPTVNDLSEHWQEVRVTSRFPDRFPQPFIDPDQIDVGAEPIDQSIPVLNTQESTAKPTFFLDSWLARAEWKDRKIVSWDFDPSVNLYDNETLGENLAVLCDQANTVRSLAAGSVHRLGRVSHRPTVRHPHDPFQPGWVLAAVKAIAAAGIGEASFQGLSVESKRLLAELGEWAGAALLPVHLSSDDSQSGKRRYEALAFVRKGQVMVYLANLTDEPLVLSLSLPAGQSMTIGFQGYGLCRLGPP